MHSTDNLVMRLGYFSGQVGGHTDGFDGVHGGYDVGQRNFEGRMLLQLSLDKELSVSNAWFKIGEKRKVTLRMGENEKKIRLCVDRERTPTVYSKCVGHPWGVSTCLSDSRYR